MSFLSCTIVYHIFVLAIVCVHFADRCDLLYVYLLVDEADTLSGPTHDADISNFQADSYA